MTGLKKFELEEPPHSMPMTLLCASWIGLNWHAP